MVSRCEYFSKMQIKNFYSASAKGYDELYGEEQIKKIKSIKKFLEDKNIKLDGEILDVGCGSGISTNCFSCIKGIDPCSELIEIAKNKYPNISFIKAYAEEIPFKNKEFDYTISITASQNFSDLNKSIKEINRVSKKGFLITILKNSSKIKELRKILLEYKNNNSNYNLFEKEDEKDAIFVVINLN